MYASIQHSVEQSLLAVGKQLKKVFSCETETLQHGVLNALCHAVGGVWKPFIDTSKVVDKSLSLIVGHSNRDELPIPGSLSAHSENREPW